MNLQLQLKILQLKLLLERLFLYKRMSTQDRFFLAAQAELGKDASPDDKANDGYGCAESVNDIHFRTFHEYISPANTLSTHEMYYALQDTTKWKQVTVPSPGTIIISPTGYSSKGAPSGHVGICGLGDIIMSNDSRSGLWLENYTVNSWKLYFGDKLGFPVLFFNKNDI